MCCIHTKNREYLCVLPFLLQNFFEKAFGGKPAVAVESF